MSTDRLANLVSETLRAQRKSDAIAQRGRLPDTIVQAIINRPPGPIQIPLPQHPIVDDEIRMAARNGNDAGLPPELVVELEEIEGQDDGSEDGDEPDAR